MTKQPNVFRIFAKSIMVGLVLLAFLCAWSITGRMLTSQSDAQVVFGTLLAIGGVALAAAFGKYVVNFFKELEKNDDEGKSGGAGSSSGDGAK